MAGFQDPKSGGDIFGYKENLTPAQMNKMLANQRHFHLQSFMAWTVMGTVNEAVGDRIAFCRFTVSTEPISYWMATPALSSTVVKSNVALSGNWTDIAHGETATAINDITAIACRPLDNAWFGLDKDAASSIGYLSFDGTTWTLRNRAGTSSTDAAAVTDMAYSPTLDRIVATWNDSRIEYNSSGTTWTGLDVTDIPYVVLWGNGAFVALTDATTSYVLYSTTGTSWAQVSTPVSMTNKLLAYDESEQVWYILDVIHTASTLTLLTSASPGSSWALVPLVSNPIQLVSSGPIESFMVNGGVISITHNGHLYVTQDFGQTWFVTSVGSGAADHTNTLQSAGGRWFLSANDGNNSGTVFIANSAFTPYQDAG